MKLNSWCCMPAAFAIALNVDVLEFIQRIGHDGGEIIWPSLKDPCRRRGFHIQECIDVASKLGFSVTPFEMFPRHAPAEPVPAYTVVFGGTEEAAMRRFASIVYRTRGVLTGYTSAAGHAVAYDQGTVYDPRGIKFAYDQCARYSFTPICAWSIT
jgi:hypothetical protein